MKSKKKWYEYLWIFSSIYILLGFVNILFAWLGLLCFMLPLLISIFRRNKAYCNKYCGRGQLFDLLGNKFNLSRKKDIPAFIRSKWFRYGFLTFFLIMFINMLYSTYLIYAEVNELREVVTLLWTFKLPWNWAYTDNTVSPWVAQFAFGFYSVMLTSTVLGLITMVLFKPRSWCVYCPMGTMTQTICKLENKASEIISNHKSFLHLDKNCEIIYNNSRKVPGTTKHGGLKLSKINMENIGLSERFITESTLYEGLYIGRVVSQYKNLYKVVTENGELTAEVSGKFRFSVRTVSDYPAVGDFVMIDRIEDISGNAIIHNVLTRKSAFIRKAAGTSNEEQIVASNIDTVFICMSLNNDFNLRRLERYLGIAWDSGAVPVIVLTKSDLCNNLSEKLREIDTVALGVDVIVTSSVSEDGYLPIKKYLSIGKTIAFIGSSGVGKSTLINRLMGQDIIETSEIRNDDKGRHTTTRREMFVIPDGGVVIDTPGMRELGIDRADLEKTFIDIDELAARCKFSDCTHTNEPKCAVREAISNGLLSSERLESYLKLKKEAKYDGLNSRQIENEKLNGMFKEFGGMKNVRKMLKEKNKYKGKY